MRTELDFNSAIKDFQRFLAEQQISDDILWIFREDITCEKRKIFIRWPLPPENYHLASTVYEKAQARGLGLQLDVFCLAGDKPCCYVWFPEDEEEAEYRMMTALKMSVPVKPVFARKIRSALMWKLINWYHKSSPYRGFMDDLTLRGEL